MNGIERMLAADIRAVTDGGGEFGASPYPSAGPANVAQFFLTGTKMYRVEVVTNGKDLTVGGKEACSRFTLRDTTTRFQGRQTPSW